MAEYKRSKKRRRSGKSFRYLPFAVLLFVIAFVIGLSGFFRLSDIVVTGANLYSEDEIIAASGLEQGDNLLFFSESRVGEEISGKLSYAGEVNVTVKYPSTVEIQMTESVAIASISAEGSYWIIDTDGKILEQTDMNGAADAISVKGIELVKPTVSSVIDCENSTKRMYLIDLLKAIYENGAADKINELDITSIANISFDYDGRYEVNFGEGGNSSEKFAAMIRIINDPDTADAGKIVIDSEGRVRVIPA